MPSFARLWPLVALMLLQACTSLPPETYTPKLGQMGKDVMWLPTRDELVTQLLTAARVGPEDEVVDLGAGDGKIPIAAARQFGARAWGIEYNKDLAALAQRNAQRAGVADRVRIVHGDIFKEDFSKATVITLYLLEELNAQLRPTILAMRPGTRVVSNTFSMGDWEPDQVIRVGTNTGYFWTVPAVVAGQWTLQGLDRRGPARLQLTQRHQRLGGTLSWGGQTQTLLGARLQGADLHFSFVQADGQLKAVQARVLGASLQGEVVGPYGMVDIQPEVVKVTGQRVGD
ncbi:class I SAM-dependent methyltransferase [Limnohabitans sp.]|uniref:class I SAM-dependent methyltransferase n=1 Tax=Limnohabitans sp. TaxID=1907725 RepID=UPI0025C3715C|nr:class I SAM-dependent methyltransferase [Limnohabitans sp.]